MCGAHHQDDWHGAGTVYLGHVQPAGWMGQWQVCTLETTCDAAQLGPYRPAEVAVNYEHSPASELVDFWLQYIFCEEH